MEQPAAGAPAGAGARQRTLSWDVARAAHPAQERFAHWRTLPPEQRQQLRSRWQQFQALPPGEREAVRQNFHRFQQLPPAQRQMLRERWRNATPAQRKEMIQRARELHPAKVPPAHAGHR